MAGKRIDHIAFRVADLEAAVRFYTETLGFAVTDRFFFTFEDGSRARCAALKGAGEVAVDDIRAEVAALKARGVRFTTDEVLESEELLQIFTPLEKAADSCRRYL